MLYDKSPFSQIDINSHFLSCVSLSGRELGQVFGRLLSD
jgi:hypothetical protein